MSFLSSNNGEVVSAKLTKTGRKAIASGSFNVSYFQIGDSEFDYTGTLAVLTGSATHQNILSPFDKDSAVKYPFSLDSNTTTTYGVPVLNPDYNTTALRNVMGPAGFVTNFATGSINGTYFTTHTESKTLSTISGGNTLSVISGNTFSINDFITLALGPTSGLTTNIITGNTTSLTYKVTNVVGNTLTLDRNLPNLTGLTGTFGRVILNKFANENNVDYNNINPTCIPTPLTSTSQLNSWTLNTIWTTKPIGADVGGTNEDLNGYYSNRYASAKNFFGYTKSSGQTFQNFSGGSANYSTTLIGTSFVNGNGDVIELLPEEQRTIAVLHYSELGDLIYDPEKYYKYDDFISHLTTTGNTIAPNDIFSNPVSDTTYFEVFIPYLYYHRSPNKADSKGARFFMDTTDYYIRSVTGITESTINIKYRYLIDENNNRVGKVFVNHKVIVFDDQELVAVLDYRSNRKYTLSAPKLRLLPTGDLAANSLLSDTGHTLWVTYVIANESGSALNALPCNYYTKISGTSTPSSVTLNFKSSEFQFLGSDIKHGFVGKRLLLFMQLTTGNTIPSANLWKYADYTNKITGSTYNGTTYITANDLTSSTYTIDKTTYDNALAFDLDSHLSGLTSNYLGTLTSSDFNVTIPQFGDEQPFPCSIRLVRGTDVEEFNFLINLPIGKFNISQNPTHTNGQDVYMTEFALLDNSKKALVIAKTPTPIKRTGAQVVSVRLDF
jgi:hypothetical protein